MTKQTTKEIKEILANVISLDAKELIDFEDDERKSVQQLVKSTKNRLEKHNKLLLHFEEMKIYENEARKMGLISLQELMKLEEVHLLVL